MYNIPSNIIAFFVYSYLCVSMEHFTYYITGSNYYYRLDNPIITAFPLYGFGAYTFIFLNYLLEQWGISKLNTITQLLIKLVIFGFAASVIEYITGKYFAIAGKSANPNCTFNGWDYSNEFMNIEGIVSLEHMILWGILGLVIIFVHPYLMKFISCGLACYGLDG